MVTTARGAARATRMWTQNPFTPFAHAPTEDRHEAALGHAPRCPCGKLAHYEHKRDAGGRPYPASLFRCGKCPLVNTTTV